MKSGKLCYSYCIMNLVLGVCSKYSQLHDLTSVC